MFTHWSNHANLLQPSIKSCIRRIRRRHNDSGYGSIASHVPGGRLSLALNALASPPGPPDRQKEREEAPKMSILHGFLFPPPPSLYISAMSVVALVSLSYSGLAEVRGKHLQYSKFWNVQSKGKGKEGIKLSSRAGMLLLYTPAFVAGAASLAFYPSPSLRFWLLSWALTIHFLKRVLEVSFVHKYSGGMILDSAILISLSYFTATVNALYAQYLTEGTPEPQIDLKYAGIVVFLVGIAGNFYHHYLLSKLREKNDKGYKIPRGGLFNLVICPHYLFEILAFIGISCISQTVYASSFTIGTIGYLMGRSYATRKWYRAKFSNFPAEVKALIPFVF